MRRVLTRARSEMYSAARHWAQWSSGPSLLREKETLIDYGTELDRALLGRSVSASLR